MGTDSNKGVKAGLTVWYTVMVAAAAVYALTVIQDLAVIMTFGSYGYANDVFGGANGWIILIGLFLETGTLILSLLTAKCIYRRCKQGYFLAIATVAAGAAQILLIILIARYTPVLSVILYSAISVAILAAAQRAKGYLTESEEKDKNDFTFL